MMFVLAHLSRLKAKRLSENKTFLGNFKRYMSANDSNQKELTVYFRKRLNISFYSGLLTLVEGCPVAFEGNQVTAEEIERSELVLIYLHQNIFLLN